MDGVDGGKWWKVVNRFAEEATGNGTRAKVQRTMDKEKMMKTRGTVGRVEGGGERVSIGGKMPPLHGR